jgi:hypothetical protein
VPNPNLTGASPGLPNSYSSTAYNENADLNVMIDLDNSFSEDVGTGLHA